MRITARKRLVEYWQKRPDAQPGLERWYQVASEAEWRTLQDVKSSFRHADAVTVGSGRTVVIFNIGGGKHRLITAIHYNTQRVFTLMVLSHADYDGGGWKEQL